jgi:hypothetical protein
VTAIVLVDAENVRRSVWPNITRDELARLVHEWGVREGVSAEVVFEGRAESADDRIVARAAELSALGKQIWIATSDRELRNRVAPFAERLLGGGALARALLPRTQRSPET